MKKELSIEYTIILLLCTSAFAFGQSERKFIRQGNGQFSKGNFQESEVLYRKAFDKNNLSPDALFNLGDALYKQEKYDDAGKNFITNANSVIDNSRKSNSYFNLGNSLLNSNKIKESIEAYKNSLRINPENPEAKYNLAYAQDLLKQQEQQQQQQQQKDQNNDQQDKDKKDQNQANDNNKDQDKQDQQQQQQQDQEDQQQEQQQTTVSKEDAQRLLDALANDEKKVQEKVKEAKAASQKVRVLINW